MDKFRKGPVPKTRNPPPPPPRPAFVQTPKLKVWFNPDRKWFEVFMPDGSELPSLGQVVVSDNLDRNESPRAIIEAVVEVVNERPGVVR